MCVCIYVYIEREIEVCIVLLLQDRWSTHLSEPQLRRGLHTSSHTPLKKLKAKPNGQDLKSIISKVFHAGNHVKTSNIVKLYGILFPPFPLALEVDTRWCPNDQGKLVESSNDNLKLSY